MYVQSDKNLFKNELSVQFKMISTRVLKKFIPLMVPLGKEKETLQVQGNSVRQKIISTSNNLLCGHLIVNKTALL